MAEWNVSLPDEKSVGDDTHVEDHNVLVKAIAEARAALDAVEAIAGAAAEAGHKHAAADVTSGTFADARIPAIAVSKVTGLQAALDAKADSADLAAKADAADLDAKADAADLAAKADSADLAAKADASALSALEDRVAALETPAG